MLHTCRQSLLKGIHGCTEEKVPGWKKIVRIGKLEVSDGEKKKGVERIKQNNIECALLMS